jgi:hypothetical protein
VAPQEIQWRFTNPLVGVENHVKSMKINGKSMENHGKSMKN